MSENNLATVYLWSNQKQLRDLVEKCLRKKSLKVFTKEKENTDYCILLINNLKHENIVTSLLDSLDTLKNFVGKICLVILNDSHSDTNTQSGLQEIIEQHLHDKTINLRVIQTFDVYDSNSDGTLSNFQSGLLNVKREKRIVVSSTGKNKYYPTSVKDLCQLIVKSLFINNTDGEFYTAIGEEITDLELAFLIKSSLEKKDLDLEIDLRGLEKEESENIPDLSTQTQANLNWLPQNNLNNILDKILENEPEPVTPLLGLKKIILEKKDQKSEIKINLHQQEKRGLKHLFKFLLISTLILLAIPPLSTYLALRSAIANTYQSFQFIRIGEVEKATQSLSRAKLWKKLATNSFQSVIPVADFIVKEETAKINNFILVLGHSQTVLESVLDNYTLGSQLFQGIIGREPVDTEVIFPALRLNLISLSEKLSQIQLLLDRLELPFGYEKKLDSTVINQQLNQLKSQITSGLPILDLLGKVTADKNLQRYLIIIQDPNELRSSGGLLTTYGQLVLDQGRIISFQADSALSLDRLIEGHIDPPPIIKTLLGEKNWLFHDSNLDADFSVSAKQVAWFYQRFKDQDLDGVIGYNLSFLSSILEEIGSTPLPDGQAVNTANFNQLASNPTTGSGLDVTTRLTQVLGAKILSGEINFSFIVRALLKTVTNNEINTWFKNPDYQAQGSRAGISGEVEIGECHPQLINNGCRPDTIYLNESNFSVSKLNYYLRRKQNFQVEINNNGEVAYTLTYDYTYPVPSPTNLNPNYLAYYQLYLPLGALELQINLDGQNLTATSLTQTLVNSLIKIDYSGSLAINQPHRLVIKFISPNKLDLEKSLSAYSLSYLKQPGTLNDTFGFKIIYPEKLTPKSLTLPMKQISANELSLDYTIAGDEDIGILFKNTQL